MPPSIEIQNPADARRLVLLFHGVGASPDSMAPLARSIAGRDPEAAVICVASPDPSDFGHGYQWFSVRNVSEDNRPARVAGAMPGFVKCIQTWQARTKVDAGNTTLVGFSQGTIMALESTQQPIPLARKIIGLSGRFAARPKIAPPGVTVALIHGDADPVIMVAHAREGATALQALGASVHLDIVPNLGHAIDSRAADRVTAQLLTGG